MWIRFNSTLNDSKNQEKWSYREVDDYFKSWSGNEFVEKIYENYFSRLDNQVLKINFKAEAIDAPPKEALE